MTLLAVTVCCVALAVAAWCLSSAVDRWAYVARERSRFQHAIERDRVTLDRRRLALEERRYNDTRQEEAVRKANAPQPMPPDLRGLVDAWDDDWAKKDAEATLMALYAEHGDWDKVRQHAHVVRPVATAEGVL